MVGKMVWTIFLALIMGMAVMGQPPPNAPSEPSSAPQSGAEGEREKQPQPEPPSTEPSQTASSPAPGDQPTAPTTPSPAEQIQKPKRKKRPFNFKVSAHGYANLQYQVGSTVQGTEQGRQVFRYDNFGLSKGFNAFGSLRLDWQIGNLRLQGDWAPFSYSPTAQRFKTEYNAGSTKFSYGNDFLSLQGNQFVTFSRYAQGLQIKHEFGKGNDLTLVTFETPSQIVTDVFQGNNSPGPYFLRRSPIIDGSEQVRLDERPLRRGVDYTIDYNYGQIMFPTPIPPTSTIAVSYETAGFGGVGRFIGFRSNLRTGEGSRLGVTFLTQQVPFTEQGGIKRRREEFLGSGTVGPFQLQVRPIAAGSERVFVNGLLQIRDTHYRINYDVGLITFLQPVPAGALVTVEYEQTEGAAARIGTLRLLGLDWNATLKNVGRVNLQFGQSSGGNRSGRAMEVHLTKENQRLAYSLRWRKITSGFTRIENSDFFRNDSGLFADLRYELVRGLSLTTQWQSSKSAGGRFFGIGLSGSGTASESSNRDLSIQLQFDRPKLPRLQISHQRLHSGFSGSGMNSEGRKTFTTVYLGYQLGHLSLEGAWERSSDRFEPRGQPQDGQQTLTASVASTGRKRFSLAFNPGSKFSALLDWSQNTSDSPQQQFRSKATQRVLTLSYKPWQSLQFDFSHQKLSGASSISSLLVGNVLTGAAAGTLSGIGGYGGYGMGGYGMGYGTGVGGYGTFGIGTRPTYGGMGGYGGVGGYGTGGYGGWGGTQGGWGTSQGGWGMSQSGWETGTYGTQGGWSNTPSWDMPSGRGRQFPSPQPFPTPTPRVTGNASTITTFGVVWTPIQRLDLMLNWSANADEGSAFVASSRQRNLSLNGNYRVTDKLNLFAQFSRDRASYSGELNESLTLMGMVGLNWGDYNGLNISLNYQRLRMQNLRVVGKVPQLEETNYSALSATLQAPIAKRWVLRARAAWLQNRSPAGIFGGRYQNREMELELTYRINRNIGFGLVWTKTRRSGDRPEQGYSASILRAALTASF